MDFLLCIVLGVGKTQSKTNDREHTMANLITLGNMAVQFIAAGTTIEWHGELFTVRSVSKKFTITRNLADLGVSTVVVDTPEGGMRALHITNDIKLPMFEWVTAEEFAASIS